MFQSTVVVKNLIIINVIFFVGDLILKTKGLDLHLEGAFPLSDNFKPWQPISSMFMHGSILHLAMNMLGLLFLGPNLEMTWGSKRFLNFYLLCGLGGYLLHFLVPIIKIQYHEFNLSVEEIDLVYSEGFQTLMSNKNFVNQHMAKLNMILNFTPSVVGASGAVLGIVTAFALRNPHQVMRLLFPPISIEAGKLLYWLAGISLVFGILNLQQDRIAHFAHLGGMLTAYIILKLWQNKKDKENRYYQ